MLRNIPNLKYKKILNDIDESDVEKAKNSLPLSNVLFKINLEIVLINTKGFTDKRLKRLIKYNDCSNQMAHDALIKDSMYCYGIKLTDFWNANYQKISKQAQKFIDAISLSKNDKEQEHKRHHSRHARSNDYQMTLLIGVLRYDIYNIKINYATYDQLKLLKKDSDYSNKLNKHKNIRQWKRNLQVKLSQQGIIIYKQHEKELPKLKKIKQIKDNKKKELLVTHSYQPSPELNMINRREFGETSNLTKKTYINFKLIVYDIETGKRDGWDFFNIRILKNDNNQGDNLVDIVKLPQWEIDTQHQFDAEVNRIIKNFKAPDYKHFNRKYSNGHKRSKAKRLPYKEKLKRFRHQVNRHPINWRARVEYGDSWFTHYYDN